MGEDVRVKTVKIWNGVNETHLSNFWVSYIDSQGTIQKNSSLSVFEDEFEDIVPKYIIEKGTFISGDYASYDSFVTLSQAQAACDSAVICTGVTLETNYSYTLRRGSTLTSSSW